MRRTPFYRTRMTSTETSVLSDRASRPPAPSVKRCLASAGTPSGDARRRAQFGDSLGPGEFGRKGSTPKQDARNLLPAPNAVCYELYLENLTIATRAIDPPYNSEIIFCQVESHDTRTAFRRQ